MPVVHTVLVVDDEAIVRELVARILAADGFRVLTADRGKKALALARALGGRLSLVVTDLQMPTMDGLELARRIAGLTPAPPVLILSAATSVPEGQSPGAFLAKPFATSDLTNVVHRLVDATGTMPTDNLTLC